MEKKIFSLFILHLLISLVYGQTNTRLIEIGFVPGISTNGIKSGEITNHFSLGLFSTYSSAILGVNISGFSNYTLHNSYGFQFSGIANIVGGNRFVGMTKTEKRKLLKENRTLHEASFTGFQLSGVGNLTTGNYWGGQISGIFNKTGNSMTGAQVGGLWNFVHDHAEGIQISGIMNLTLSSFTGFQSSLIFNYAGTNFHGLQFGLINKCKILLGRKSRNKTFISGYQTGFLNITKKNGGVQVGLINIGNKNTGKQIGLINYSENQKGRAIGLLNIGTTMNSLQFTTDPLYATNISLNHGTIHFKNAWTFGYNPFLINCYTPRWKMGYSYLQMKLSPICLSCEFKKLRAWGFSIENYRYPNGLLNKNISSFLEAKKAWLLKSNSGIFLVLGVKGGPTFSKHYIETPTSIYYFKNTEHNMNVDLTLLPYIGILYI